MKIESQGITISLTKEEITDLWNIILFAFDWQDSEITKDKPKMNDSELKLANELYDILNKFVKGDFE
jgi:hypothetical protein